MATTTENGSTTRASEVVSCDEHGGAPLLANPTLNKGTAFTFAERQSKHLEGLLPPKVETMDQQAKRVMWQLHTLPRDLEKYALLLELSATNQRLFYKVLLENLVELLPIVYTPTVGEGCVNFHRVFMNPLGMYFSAFQHRGRFREMLDNWPSKEVDIIVVTDGGRILGLGDLGANGMGISIGKVSLYVAGAGFNPERAMPVLLDCGTDNADLLNDEFYLGEKKPRLTGQEHLGVVREFCQAVQNKWPSCLIQFEDFKTPDAFAILESLRDDVLCFNDDIQGTAAVVSAGFLNGMKVQGTNLRDVRIVFYGAGSSAVGVAHMLASLIQCESGLTKEEAYKAIYLVDTRGLITNTREGDLASHKQPFARWDGTPDMTNLVEIVRHVKPHALFGLTGAGPAFTEEVVTEMCRHCERPLIFPLSNPTSQAEISAENAYNWSKGKCLFAAGSPFRPVEYNGRTYIPGQANNVFIFPGVGFGSVAVKARKVTDDMLITAARTLARAVKQEDLDAGRLYPDVQDLRSISITISREVAKKAVGSNVAELTGIKMFPVHIISRIWNYES